MIVSETLLTDVCDQSYFRLNSRIRTEATKRQYRFALADLAAAIGHPPTVADLTDDSVSALITHLVSRNLAAKTVNERRGRINALWSWLARRGYTAQWPTVKPITEPRRVPVAWSHDELRQLLAACRDVPGTIAGVRACDWWVSLHQVAWSTGERITALLSCRWSDLSGEWLTITAEHRKGKAADAQYRLSSAALEALAECRRPDRQQIWPWPLSPTYLWIRYRTIRRKAGLPDDRRSAFHRIRRSVASHFEAAGGNATTLLGHTSRAVTVRSYLDPRIVRSEQAADRLFRIE